MMSSPLGQRTEVSDPDCPYCLFLPRVVWILLLWAMTTPSRGNPSRSSHSPQRCWGALTLRRLCPGGPGTGSRE